MFNPFRLAGAALCVAIVSLLAMPAYAQDIVAGVDLGWVWDYVVPFLVTVITIFGGLLIAKLQTWTGLKIEAEHRAAIEQALQRATEFALAKAGDAIKPRAVIKTDNPIVIMGANYARAAIPDALKKFGIDEERLRQMIIARLQPAAVTPEIVAD